MVIILDDDREIFRASSDNEGWEDAGMPRHPDGDYYVVSGAWLDWAERTGLNRLNGLGAPLGAMLPVQVGRNTAVRNAFDVAEQARFVRVRAFNFPNNRRYVVRPMRDELSYELYYWPVGGRCPILNDDGTEVPPGPLPARTGEIPWREMRAWARLTAQEIAETRRGRPFARVLERQLMERATRLQQELEALMRRDGRDAMTNNALTPRPVRTPRIDPEIAQTVNETTAPQPEPWFDDGFFDYDW